MLRLQSGGLLIIPNEKNCLFYTIAGITICFETEWKEEVNNDFKPFLGNNGENEYLVSFQMVEKLREYSGEYIYIRTRDFLYFLILILNMYGDFMIV